MGLENLSPLHPALTGPLYTLWCLNTGNREIAQSSAMMRVASHVWGELTGEGEMEALRAATILEISQYVKTHPKASQAELAAEVQKRIAQFAEKVEAM